jgi:ABC-2 type transport system ATP-binding protein
VGFLPERPYFYGHLSAVETLVFYGRLFGIHPQQALARAMTLLDRFELLPFADVPLTEFSKGMLQRVGLAQALINSPRLLILDEPMSGLDPVGRMLVRDALLAEREKDVTILFCSHVLHDVESISDRVGVLVGGGLVSEGTVAQLVGDRVRAVDCVIDLDEQVQVTGTEINRQGRLRIIRVGPSDVDALIGEVHAAKGKVKRVHPLGTSLEDILVDEIQRAGSRQRGVLA